MDQMIYGNSLLDWLTALGIALAINLVVGVLKWLIGKHLAHFFTRNNTILDDSIERIAERTRQWLVFVMSAYIGSNYLTLPPRVDVILMGAATIAAFLQAGLWGGALLDFWINRYRTKANGKDPGAATSLSALNFVGRTVLWSVMVLLALDNLGVNVTALVAGLGVGGIAVALAVQNILGDLFASLSIVIDKPFVIGDFIIVDDMKGTVEHVGLKTTRVRSLDGEQLVFSNSDLLSARVRNYKRMRERRALFKFGVLYQTPVTKVEAIPGIVRRIIEEQPKARFDRAHFIKFGDSSLDFEVVYWVSDPDYVAYANAQQAINLALMREFEKEKIGFAYPTRSLFVESPVKVELANNQA